MIIDYMEQRESTQPERDSEKDKIQYCQFYESQGKVSQGQVYRVSNHDKADLIYPHYVCTLNGLMVQNPHYVCTLNGLMVQNDVLFLSFYR